VAPPSPLYSTGSSLTGASGLSAPCGSAAPAVVTSGMPSSSSCWMRATTRSAHYALWRRAAESIRVDDTDWRRQRDRGRLGTPGLSERRAQCSCRNNSSS